MAVDQRKVDKLTSSRVTPGSELGDLTEVQNQLGAINAERQNNLSQEMLQAKSERDNNDNLRTAAEIGTSNNGVNVQQVPYSVPTSNSNLSPETKKVLAGYGVNPNVDKNSVTSSGTSSSQSNRSNSNTVNGQGVVNNSTTINNVTNNTTTKNDTKVEVVNRGVELQRPAIPAAGQDQNNTAKFKAWLNNAFAKQNERYEIQKKEYTKRDWSLRRTGEKLTKKLGEVTKSVANKLDPANMGRSFTSQMGIMLTMVGVALLSKFWKPIREWMHSFTYDFKTAFGLPGADKNKSGNSFLGKLNNSIGKFFGGKEGTSMFSSIGDSISQGFKMLWEDIKDFFAERAEAVRGILGDGGIDSSDWGVLGNQLKGPVKKIGAMLAALIGGNSGLANSLTKDAVDNSKKGIVKKEEGSMGMYTTDLMDQKKLYEDTSYTEGKNGKILNRDASVAASNIAFKQFSEKSNILNPFKVAATVNEIYKTNKETTVPVDRKLLSEIYGLTNEQIRELIKRGLAKPMSEYRQKRFKVVHPLFGFNEPGSVAEGAKNSSLYKNSKFNQTDDEVIKGNFLELAPGTLEAIEKLYNVSTNFNDAKSAINLESKMMKYRIDKLKMDASKFESGISVDIKNPFQKSQYWQDRYDYRHDPKNPEYHNWNALKENAGNLVGDLMISSEDAKNKMFKYAGLDQSISDENLKEKITMSMSKFMKELGLTREQAAGIVGNLIRESQLIPTSINKEEKRLGYKGYGRGIAQWSNERVQKYKNETGVYPDEDSLENQLSYIINELKNERPKTLSALKSSRSYQESADAFLRGYENGGNGLTSIDNINKVYSNNEAGANNYETFMTKNIDYSKLAIKSYSPKVTKYEATEKDIQVTKGKSDRYKKVYYDERQKILDEKNGISKNDTASILDSDNSSNNLTASVKTSKVEVPSFSYTTPVSASYSSNKVNIPEPSTNLAKSKKSEEPKSKQPAGSDRYMADNRQISDNHSVTVTNNYYGDNKNSAQILNT